MTAPGPPAKSAEIELLLVCACYRCAFGVHDVADRRLLAALAALGQRRQQPAIGLASSAIAFLNGADRAGDLEAALLRYCHLRLPVGEPEPDPEPPRGQGWETEAGYMG